MQHLGLYYRVFKALIVSYCNKLVFVTLSHFHPNLIIVGKAGAYPSGVLHVVIMHPYLNIDR